MQLCTADAHQTLLEAVASIYEDRKTARERAGLAGAVDSGAESTESGSDDSDASSDEEGSDSGSGSGSGSSGSEEDGSEVRPPTPPLSSFCFDLCGRKTAMLSDPAPVSSLFASCFGTKQSSESPSESDESEEEEESESESSSDSE